MHPSFKMKLVIFIAFMMAASGAFLLLTQSQNPIAGADNFGTPGIFGTQNLQSLSLFPKVSKSTTQLESVEVLLSGLRNRLEIDPDDADGWLLLSKSYDHLNRLSEAKMALEKAKALGYIGNWKPLPQIGSASRQIYPSENTPSDAGLSSSNGKRTSGAGIKLKVSLAPGLVNELSQESIVFIFARAVDNPGPPLAALRKKVSDLPLEITLNDSHAMIQGRTISKANRIVVGARVSLSGNPVKQKGDFEQLSNPVPSDFGQLVKLVISDKI